MEVTRQIEIARAVEEVFAFVADPLNDPRWCPKVQSVEHLEGEGAGAVYAVVHKPVPLRPARKMRLTCVSSTRPHRIALREEDGTDVFNVTYEFESTTTGTRLRQRSEATLGAPRILQPLFRKGVDRDIAGQLKRLKELLES